MFTVARVDVAEAGERKLVDTAALLQPVDVEILPEARRPEIEHAAPIAADVIDGACIIARLRFGLENVVSVESAVAARAAAREHLVRLGGRNHSRQR